MPSKLVLHVVSLQQNWRTNQNRKGRRTHYPSYFSGHCPRYMIGKLSFAYKVVPAGPIFLHRLIDLSCSVSKLHHHICITNEARLDLLWWSDFLPSWSGTSMILESSGPSAQLCSYLQMLQAAKAGVHFGLTIGSNENGPLSNQCRHSMERTVCYSLSGEQVGSPLV